MSSGGLILSEIVHPIRLEHNAIASFILRIDLQLGHKIDLAMLANDLSKNFDRLEKHEVSSMVFTANEGLSDLKAQRSFDFVLIAENQGLKFTISQPQNALIVEASRYVSNTTYKTLLPEIVGAVRRQDKAIGARRIGLRYINQFTSPEKSRVNRILAKPFSTILGSLKDSSDSMTRIIVMNEFNFAEDKARVQFGFPNKFYPGLIASFDILLDIDCYDDGEVRAIDWEDCSQRLNHRAYGIFSSYVLESFILEMK